MLYKAAENRKEIVVGVNAGHGTSGGTKVKTLCHPDGSAKVTGGTTAAGATEAVAVSSGMTFNDGTPESSVTLRMAQILKEKLLAAKKAGIHMVLVPEKNEPDVRELDAEITDGLQIEFVGSMEQVLKLALVEKK